MYRLIFQDANTLAKCQHISNFKGYIWIKGFCFDTLEDSDAKPAPMHISQYILIKVRMIIFIICPKTLNFCFRKRCFNSLGNFLMGFGLTKIHHNKSCLVGSGEDYGYTKSMR